MLVQSSLEIEIKNYINSHSELGKWPLELNGKKEILPFYSIPIDLLRYNINNGRLAMDIHQWEIDNGRKLDINIKADVDIIRNMLLTLEPGKTTVLKDDLRKKGQMEPGVITSDGIVINGNRRMAIYEVLHEEEPTGKWKNLDVVVLPPNVSQQDLWKIEAGLQLSREKVAEYHPVNELLKIKQGKDAKLSNKEIAAAMYGRTESEIKDSLERLYLIETFLKFWGQPTNYGLIKKFGLHEYFINIQKNILRVAEKNGVGKKEINNRLHTAFALIRSHVLVQDKGGKGIKHFDIRDLGKIYANPKAYITYLEAFQGQKKINNLDPETVLESYRNAKDVLELEAEKDKPIKLVNRAIKALESIDRKSEHFKDANVKLRMKKLSEIVQCLESEMGL